MTARGTDWGLAALIALLIVTGVLTLFAGGSGDEWVFAAHDALAVAITALTIVKLKRVWPRLKDPSRRSLHGVATTALVLAALGSGFLWSDGVTPAPVGYSLLAWHEAVGAVLVVGVAVHMLSRARRPRKQDLTNRRQFLTLSTAAAGSLLAWRLQRPAQSLFGLRAARRRFTGSYEAGSFDGNAFPTTSWVADAPAPIDSAPYRLHVTGLVKHPLSLPLTHLAAGDELIATLDCTGGFYSTQRWRGISVNSLIAQAGADPAARHLNVISVTGYRWSFALADARALLLATHLGDEPLSHAHGAPVRLVVPAGRGFQWIKWVVGIELRATPDFTAPASTVWSSFTPAARGARQAVQ